MCDQELHTQEHRHVPALNNNTCETWNYSIQQPKEIETCDITNNIRF